MPQAARETAKKAANTKNKQNFFMILKPFCYILSSIKRVILLKQEKHKTYIAVIKMIKYILGIILSCSISVAVASQRGVNIYETPRELPSRSLMRSDGTEIKLTDFDDDFVVAVFWSRHCMPCIKELNDLQEFADKTADKGIKVVLISPSQEWSNTLEQREFLDRFGAEKMDFYIDEKSNLAADLGIFTSPNAVLISKQGYEIGRLRGSAKWGDDRVVEYINRIKTEKSDMVEND